MLQVTGACGWGTYIIIMLIEDNHINFTWFCISVTQDLAAKKCVAGLINVTAGGQWNVIRNVCQFSRICFNCVCVKPCTYSNISEPLDSVLDFQIQLHNIITALQHAYLSVLRNFQEYSAYPGYRLNRSAKVSNVSNHKRQVPYD